MGDSGSAALAAHIWDEGYNITLYIFIYLFIYYDIENET